MVRIGVTINARKINSDFTWQEQFHDRIIRDQYSLKKTLDYIIINPSNWDEDVFFMP